MYNLWNNKAPFPAIEETKEIKNIEHITVHTAIKGEYQFLLGSAIIKHKGTFYSSWGNSLRQENDNNTILAEKRSYDNVKTWTGLEESNFPISDSKMYGGTLSNGNNYIVFNLKRQKRRETLCIAIGKEQFDTVYVIRHGFDKPPMYYRDNEWCYPYAYEDKESNKLYVVYAKNKEDCELSIIPVEELSR